MKYFFILINLVQLIQIFNTSMIRMMSDYSCKYTLNDNSQVNLSSLRRSVDYTFQIGRYSYKANFCGTLEERCPGSAAPAAIFIQNNICFNHISSEWGDTKLQYIDDNSPSKGLKLSFPPGDMCFFGGGKFNLVYILECDTTVDSQLFSVTKKQMCDYEFKFKTKMACQTNFEKSSSFSSKGILFALIALFSVYCLGFFLKNYRENPEDGVMKALPHREFWSNFIENANYGLRIILRFAKNKLKVNDATSGYTNY